MTFNPTPQQLAICEFIANNPNTSLMIDARAGSAKTSTIVLAAKSILTRPVLSVAFNKRNAEDLATKLPSDFECKTLNGLGHGAWQKVRNGRLQLDADKMFKIAKEVCKSEAYNSYDEKDDTLITALNLARAAKSSGLVPLGAPMGVKGLIHDHDDNWREQAWNKGIDANSEDIVNARNILLKSIDQGFKGLIDFDDQIYLSVLFGGSYAKYHTVMVDEAQDLSPLNHLQLKKSVGTRLIAVGDPYQAIYAFRGADSNSMTNLFDLFHSEDNPFERLKLTYSFRAPKLVSARQLHHVNDFQSWETNPEGVVEFWPQDLPRVVRGDDGGVADADLAGWSIDSIPHAGAILCRNNAPLMKLAFALIKARRPVTILGRDIGAQLGNLLWKIAGKVDMPVEQIHPLLDDWQSKELAKAGDSEGKQSTVYDKRECLDVLVDASGESTISGCCEFIKKLFSDRPNGELILSSGHRAKGMEWKWVMHLDPERCPSQQAVKALHNGNPAPMMQENNLKYVIETRTQHTLVMASLNDCEEVE